MILWKEVIRPMKAIRIFNRNIASALKSIFRNFSLSIASIVCTTITLVIVSLAIIFSANVNNFTKELESTLTIIVFADRDATAADEDNIETFITYKKNLKALYQMLKVLHRHNSYYLDLFFTLWEYKFMV